ncbi:MAG: DUF3592 domain-containing protein [Proteobacteria bacterium]|nr:DUF3592 domain-containing protein [Pseudomonadota bacterium]
MNNTSQTPIDSNDPGTQNLLFQSLLIVALTLCGSWALNSLLPDLNDKSMQSARIGLLIYLGLCLLVTILILSLNATLFPNIPAKVLKSRPKMASIILLPSLLIPVLWGMEPERISSSIFLIFAPYVETTAHVEDVVSRGHYRVGSMKHFYEVYYDYEYQSKHFKGSSRSKDKFDVGQTIDIIVGRDKPQYSALAQSSYQWKFSTQRWMVGSIVPLLGAWFLAFVVLAWKDDKKSIQ